MWLRYFNSSRARAMVPPSESWRSKECSTSGSDFCNFHIELGKLKKVNVAMKSAIWGCWNWGPRASHGRAGGCMWSHRLLSSDVVLVGHGTMTGVKRVKSPVQWITSERTELPPTGMFQRCSQTLRWLRQCPTFLQNYTGKKPQTVWGLGSQCTSVGSALSL